MYFNFVHHKDGLSVVIPRHPFAIRTGNVFAIQPFSVVLANTGTVPIVVTGVEVAVNLSPFREGEVTCTSILPVVGVDEEAVTVKEKEVYKKEVKLLRYDYRRGEIVPGYVDIVGANQTKDPLPVEICLLLKVATPSGLRERWISLLRYEHEKTYDGTIGMKSIWSRARGAIPVLD
jgi:hypothetical protein